MASDAKQNMGNSCIGSIRLKIQPKQVDSFEIRVDKPYVIIVTPHPIVLDMGVLTKEQHETHTAISLSLASVVTVITSIWSESFDSTASVGRIGGQPRVLHMEVFLSRGATNTQYVKGVPFMTPNPTDAQLTLFREWMIKKLVEYSKTKDSAIEFTTIDK